MTHEEKEKLKRRRAQAENLRRKQAAERKKVLDKERMNQKSNSEVEK